MPLTPTQIDSINELLDGEENLEQLISNICWTRDSLRALLRIHEDISDANITIILQKVKARIGSAAEAIIALLG